jgi:hypothetical protein
LSRGLDDRSGLSSGGKTYGCCSQKKEVDQKEKEGYAKAQGHQEEEGYAQTQGH